jgi:uncharacterized membrane protein
MATAWTDDEFRGRLAVEVEAWQRDGLITPEQARSILARYELRGAAARAFRLGPVATFISVVGAIVLGTGVVYFFAANWEVLPAWFKVLLVYAGTGASYAAGYWVQFRSRVLPRVGAGLILLGAILFQAGIFLLAQIFNMPVDSPVALLIGAAGILPLAYAVGSRLVLVFGLVDAEIWLGWQLFQWYPDSPESYAVPLMIILFGVLLYCTGHLHQLRRDPHGFVPVYQMLGLLAILAPAYFFTFGAIWEDAQRHDLASLDVPLWLAGAVLLALLGAASLLVHRRDPFSLAEAAVFALVALIVALVAYVPRWADAYALVFNAVYFGLALLMVVRGYLEGEARFVNLGIPVLALGLITRYIDVFWDLLPRSAFYIIGGLVLLGIAAGLERLRRRLLSEIEQQPPGARPAQA